MKDKNMRNNKWYPTLILAGVAAIGLSACDQADDSETVEIATDDAISGDVDSMVTLESDEEIRVVADLRVDGHEVKFVEFPGTGEVAVGEIIDLEGDSDFILSPEDDLSALEAYLSLVPADAPVPAALVAAHGVDGEVLAEGHEIVDEVQVAPIAASAEVTAAPDSSRAVGWCTSGSSGDSYFAANQCGTLGGSGYGSGGSWCFSNAHDDLQKTSSNTKRFTYSLTAACGGSGSNAVRIRHRYYNAGWNTQLNVNASANTLQQWWTYRCGVKKTRRVNTEDTQSAAWSRTWLYFKAEDTHC